MVKSYKINKKTTKTPYCKPAIRIVEWDFNESICNFINNSVDVNMCIKARAKGSVLKLEQRPEEYIGDWNWTGSRDL